ncbi:MAG TPA: NUDIX hydrolase [Streptosporangiaceae bacterium]
MPPVTFTDAETWYAGLPSMHAAAAALITDPDGRVLIVKPNYRDHWQLPGGVLEHGEPPHEGCAREVEEETGLRIVPRQLLVLDWVPPGEERPRPFVFFVFEGGEIATGTEITVQEEELDGYKFIGIGEFGTHFPAFMVRRYTAALDARATGAPIYLPFYQRS